MECQECNGVQKIEDIPLGYGESLNVVELGQTE